MKLPQSSLWRVPALSLVTGFLAYRLEVELLIRLGGGDIERINRLSLTVVPLLGAALILLSGFLFLRRCTRRAIFHSCTVMAVYGAAVLALELGNQLLGYSGHVAVACMYLSEPLYCYGAFTRFAALTAAPDWLLWAAAVADLFLPYVYVLFGRRPDREKEVS